MWILCLFVKQFSAVVSSSFVIISGGAISQLFWYCYVWFLCCGEQNILRPLILLDICKNCGVGDKVMIVYRKAGTVSLLLNFLLLDTDKIS